VDADALYALAPEDFTAARDEAARQARAAGDPAAAKALKALRRPSVSAWLVNRLAAERPDLLEQLLALGPALAQAQAGGDAAALRALGRERRSLVAAVTSVAVEGRGATGAVRAELSATLEAALADPASASAVRSGRLVRALSYAGLGGVDLTDAVAATPPRQADHDAERAVADRAAHDAKRAAHDADRAAAERAAHDAAGRLDDAVSACEQARRRHADASATAADADVAVAHARAALAAAEQDRAAAGSAQQDAETAAAAALDAAGAAQATAQTARQRLDALRRP